MKKTMSFLIAFTILLSSIQSVIADEIARVYSDVNTYTEKTINIPVKIENNNGLMGYKFTVKAKNLSISDITQGETFSDGMFNYKIGEKKETAEIIWTNNSPIKVDGELFSITADVKDNKTSCEVDLIYSPSDTIDGNYNEVSLACDLIVISPENEKTQPTTTNTSYDNQAQESLILEYINGVESDDVKQAIVASLDKAGVKIDTDKKYTAEEIKKNIDSLSNEQKSEFIKQFNIEFSKQNNSLPAVPEKDGIAIIKEILDCTDEYTVKSITQPTEPIFDEELSSDSTSDESKATKDEVGNGWIIPVLVIAVCVVAAILFIIIMRRRRMKNEV